MNFAPLAILGAMRVTQVRRSDDRGYFARVWCANEFAGRGLPTNLRQASVSYNRQRGTLRGLHFQWPPSREDKLVRCTRGALYDVLLDIRPTSATYLQHVSLELDQDSGEAVFVPHGVAHGFQTLADDTEVLYCMTDVYAPALADGLRWNDPAFAIRWPLAVSAMSEADAARAAFDRHTYESRCQRQQAS
jgi:dTDP-4-dehydrorhamnose 3,5-epimerase